MRNDDVTAIDELVKAALLWDVPALNADDQRTHDWRRVMRLDLHELGPFVEDDPLSVASYVARAMILDEPHLDQYRQQLETFGAVGVVLDKCLTFVIGATDPGERPALLRQLRDAIATITDIDLQARLYLRVGTWAMDLDQDLSKQLLGEAIHLTDLRTRLGVTARRAGVAVGVDVPDFSLYDSTATPDDPLLSLPWVVGAALKAASAMAVDRTEQRFRGPWDTQFSWGRTRFDDLEAAQLQAEWCGASGLLGQVRDLMAADIFSAPDPQLPAQRWAVKTWALRRHKRTFTALQRSERAFDGQSAVALLNDLETDPAAPWQAFVDVALGTWDLVDDDAVPRIVDRAVELLTDSHHQPLVNLVSNLFWRAPDYWIAVARSAHSEQRALMLDSLPAPSLPYVQKDHLAHLVALGSDGPGIHSGMASVLALGSPLETTDGLSTEAVLSLLRWNRESIATDALEKRTVALLASNRKSYEDALGGKFAFGAGDERVLLGHLGSYSDRSDEIADFLIGVVETRDLPGTWFMGALEGIAALVGERGLRDEHMLRLRRADMSPGSDVFGERITPAALDAARLLALAPGVSTIEVTRLAVAGRSPEPRARILAMTALGRVATAPDETATWSLVAGIFDPDEEVVGAAINALEGAAVASSAAIEVVRMRLIDLYENGSRRIRADAVGLVGTRRDLDHGSLLERGSNDPSWRVRRRAAQATDRA